MNTAAGRNRALQLQRLPRLVLLAFAMVLLAIAIGGPAHGQYAGRADLMEQTATGSTDSTQAPAATEGDPYINYYGEPGTVIDIKYNGRPAQFVIKNYHIHNAHVSGFLMGQSNRILSVDIDDIETTAEQKRFSETLTEEERKEWEDEKKVMEKGREAHQEAVAPDAPANVSIALEIYDTMLGTCFMCTFTVGFFLIGDTFAGIAYDAIAVELFGFLSILFSVWMIIQGTKLLVPSVNDQPAQVLRGIVTRSLLFSIVMILITPYGEGRNEYFAWGPELFTSATIKASTLLIGSVHRNGDSDVFQLAEREGIDLGGCGSFDRSKVNNAIYGSDRLPDSVSGEMLTLSNESVDDLTCMIHQMQITAGLGLAVAGRMYEQFDQFSGFTFMRDTVPAIILAFIFSIVLVAFVFYMFDAIVRMVVMSGLAPVLLGLAVFKPTRDMAVTGFKVMISGAMSFLGLAFVFGLGMTVMNTVPGMVMIDPGDGERARGAFSIFELIQAMTNDQLAGSFNITTSAFWYMVLAGILILTLMRKVGELIKTVMDTAAADPDSMGVAAQNLTKGALATGATSAVSAVAGAYTAGKAMQAGGSTAGAVTKGIGKAMFYKRALGSGRGANADEGLQ